MTYQSFQYFDGATALFSAQPVNYMAQAQVGQSLIGTALSDKLVDNAGGNYLAGGLGDDTYLVTNERSVVSELPGQGVDTIVAYADYTLPDNVEILNMSTQNVTGRASSNNSVLIASAYHNELVGGAGNDVMIDNGPGSNTFAFNLGSNKDVVYNFNTTAGAHDAISLRGFGITNFSQVQGLLSQSGADTVLTLNGHDSILLKGVTASSLTAADFKLDLDTSHLKMTFDDEFNSLSLYNEATGAGTWKPSYAWGPANGAQSNYGRTQPQTGEREAYVDPGATGLGSTPLGLNPFSISNDGVLSITAHKMPAADKALLYGMDYTSGMITTEKTFAQTYGYFEMRAQLPSENGSFPAFWMLPADHSWPPELDIMEHVNNFSTVSQGFGTPTGSGGGMAGVDGPSTGFHTYGLLWTKDYLTYFVDGHETTQVATPAAMDKPFYMIANLAMAGDWSGPTDANFTSATEKIDYIRAYSLNGDPLAAPPVTAPVAGSGTGYDLSSTTDVTANHIYGTSGNDVLTGTAGADVIDGGKGADVMTGGAGDDIYYVDGQADRVIEAAGGGNDTVVSGATYTLPDNVENLILRYTGSAAGNGNALDNHITGNSGDNILDGKGGNDVIDGGAGNDVIIGGAGNDILTGGAGTDTFRFAKWSGNDVVTDFGVGGHDVIDISAWLRSGIAPTLQDNANGVAIMFRSGDSIELLGVHAHDLITTNLGYSI